MPQVKSSLVKRYQQAVLEKQLQRNPSQEAAIETFDRTYQDFINHSNNAHQGIYLWGEVGRGKTFLMDLFYKNLDTSRKERLHFQSFMRFIHRSLYEKQGQVNPLQEIASDLAKRFDVLCLDELLIEDVADAKIMGSLIKALLQNGLFLVITANLIPKQLYEKGWQREQFLPAIALLEKHLQVLHIQNAEDYRRQSSSTYRIFLTPDSADTEQEMKKIFLHYATPPFYDHGTIDLNDHIVNVHKRSEEVLWCDFQALCGSNRSAADYLVLSQSFKVILLSHVPLLDADHENEARRFMSLVDACYDAHTLLIISASTSLFDLYQGNLLRRSFERSISRLFEMQTDSYYQ